MKPLGGGMPLDRGAGDDHYGASKNLDGTCKGSKTAGEPCPGSSYDTAGCLSKLFFCWVNPVTTQCLSGSVEPKELPPLSKADMTEMRRGVLDRSLRIEELTSRNPSILKATLREFWPALLTAALWSMVRETLSFANTFLLKEILKDDAGEWQGPWQQGLTAAGTLSAVQLLLVFLESHLDFYTCRVMIRVETALLTALYKRMLNADALGTSAIFIRKTAFQVSSGPGPPCQDQAGIAANRRPTTQEPTAGHGGVAGRKGAIFNVVFVDIPSIAEMVLTSVDLVILPVRIALAATLLVLQVGGSCIPGVLTLVIIVLLTVGLEAYNGTLKIPFMKRRDVRLERSHECLTKMRALRLLGWEDIAEDIVNKERARELSWRSFRMYLSGISYWLTSVAGAATSVATFAAYTIPFIQGRAAAINMRADLVIPVIHMMDNFIGPLADLPYTISTLIEGQISLNRIRHYLFRPQGLALRDTTIKSAASDAVAATSQHHSTEAEPLLKEQRERGSGEEQSQKESVSEANQKLLEVAQKMFQAVNDPTLKVRFLEASFSWIPPGVALSGLAPTVGRACKDLNPVLITGAREGGGRPSLDRITLDLRCGELLLVTGPPGSGKTTLVQAILQKDDLCLSCGSCYIRDSFGLGKDQREQMAKAEGLDPDLGESALCRAPIGYIPQEAWLCGGTVRENIIFGEAFHMPTYAAVVKACELGKDFESWRHGDLRVIDEGGLDLSGGQRVRVNIARAIYSCKMYQMRMKALGAQAERMVRSSQQDVSECLTVAVAREAEGMEGYQDFRHAITSFRQSAQEPSFACMLCFDECFNSLDLSVAGHVFHNLFGPNGLLEDCAVLVALNDSSLVGLVRQHAGQAGFYRHRKGYLDGASPGQAPVVEGRSRMKVSICRLVQGAITWRGGINEFRQSLNWAEPPGKEGTERPVGTIENLLAEQESGSDEDVSGTLLTRCAPGRMGIPIQTAPEKLNVPGESEELRTLAVAEPGARGRVRASSYVWYLTHTRKSLAVLFFLIVTCVSVSDVASDLWLTKWTGLGSSYASVPEGQLSSAPLNATSKNKMEGAKTSRSLHRHFLWIFVSIVGVNMIFELGEKIVGVTGSMMAAATIHQRLWAGVCNAPMWFYDRNPIGRILNRFSTDVSIIDCGILRRIGYSFTAAVSCILSVLVLSVACKWVIPLWPVILFAIYLLVFRYFRSTSREVQRASLLSFSPLCSCFSESLSGREVITALRKEHFFLRDMTYHLELCQRTKQMQWSISSWSNIRLQLMLFPLVVMNSTLPRILDYATDALPTIGPHAPNQVNLGLIGLAISYSISIAGSVRRLLTNLTIMEKDMCSVERVQNYLADTEFQRLDRSGAALQPAGSPPAGQRGILPYSAALPMRRTGLQLVNVEIRYKASTAEDTGVIEENLVSPLEPKAPARETLSSGHGQPEQQLSPREHDPLHDLEANCGAAVSGLMHRQPAYFLKASIRDFSAHVRVGERIGIVGRTGAGKSTLLQAVYGLLPCHKGAIFLDGVRLDCLPRQVIRNVIGTLPQRSVVLEGWTVRDVLDPRRLHTNDALWDALRVVGLDAIVDSLPGGAKLDTILMAETSSAKVVLQDKQSPSAVQGLPAEREGASFEAPSRPLSAWQLRYLALARLIVEASKLRVVLIDEPPAEELWAEAVSKLGNAPGAAGASGDAEAPPTWGRPMQVILAEHLKGCCVIIVAHHLASLRGCDRVWVLSDGCKVGECLPSDIDTEQKFNRFIAACTRKPQ